MEKENNPGVRIEFQQLQNVDQAVKNLKEAYQALAPVENVKLNQELKAVMEKIIKD
ncbi:MAG: hypothetical protein JST10_05155 [Bacteroidetes bacterium]|nr:hypothetical protein [Bacteroidota bacterium]